MVILSAFDTNKPSSRKHYRRTPSAFEVEAQPARVRTSVQRGPSHLHLVPPSSHLTCLLRVANPPQLPTTKRRPRAGNKTTQFMSPFRQFIHRPDASAKPPFRPKLPGTETAYLRKTLADVHPLTGEHGRMKSCLEGRAGRITVRTRTTSWAVSVARATR